MGSNITYIIIGHAIAKVENTDLDRGYRPNYTETNLRYNLE